MAALAETKSHTRTVLSHEPEARKHVPSEWPEEKERLEELQELRDAGLVFYDWPHEAGMTRFVTHFGTDPAEIARALEVIAASQ